jgi:NAD+ synthase
MKTYEIEVGRICEFIKEYITESKINGVVIGISGGLDSAIVAALAVKTLGPERVYCYYLPYGKKKKDLSLTHAKLICKNLNLTLLEEDIKSSVDAVSSIPLVSNQFNPLSIGNIKSRMRMILLYHIAQMKHSIVLGTTNRSEWVTGYFTKFGDGGCDLEPLLHLYKTEIFEIAKQLNIPNEIINKSPSADLWEGQTDEKELGITYKKLDRILMMFAGEKGLFYEINNIESYGITMEDVKTVAKLVDNSKHKRRLPPCLERE